MAQYGISEALVYNPKPKAATGSKVRISQVPLNGQTFNPGDTIQISVPCGTKGQYLNTQMSYLKMRIYNGTAGAANTMTPDYSASSFIRLLEVTYGSNVLEYISEYNVLYHTLFDSQGSPTQALFSGNILEAMHPNFNRAGVDIDGDEGYRTVCIPLLSGVLGTLQNRYVPVGDMVRNMLRLQLTLANQNDPHVSPAARDWFVKDCELVCEMVVLNSETARAISAANSGGYRIPMQTYSAHSSSLEVGTGNCNILMSGNYRSLKTLLTVFRKQSNAVDVTKKYITERFNPFGSTGRWQFNVGGIMIPQKPVDSPEEAYAELMKAFHAYGSLDNHGLFTWSDFQAAEGTFIAAQDMETQSHKSMLSEGGVDVSSATIHFVGQFAAPLTDALRCDQFAHYDAVLFVDNTGMASTLF